MMNQVLTRKKKLQDNQHRAFMRAQQREKLHDRANLMVTRDCVEVWKISLEKLSENLPLYLDKLEALIIESATYEWGPGVGVHLDRENRSAWISHDDGRKLIL